MDAEERKAAFIEARAEAYEKSLARHSVSAKPEPAPTLSADEVRRMIAEAVAALPRALTSDETETLVERVLSKYSVLTPKAIAPVLDEMRKQLRGEIAKAYQSNEFFYLDDDGQKQDADLHGPILRAVDYPIDEKIMAPIRERNRAKWLAGQKSRAARIIDLPNPLSARRG